jgi:hypothetical protein
VSGHFLRALAFLAFSFFCFFVWLLFSLLKKIHFFTIKRAEEPHDPQKTTNAQARTSFALFFLFFSFSLGPRSGVFLRPEWTAIALTLILKILGERKSLALRLVSKQTCDTIDSLYSMAFPNVAPRIFVSGPDITGARLTRVRSILIGPNAPNGLHRPNGPNGTKKATIVLMCDSKGPGAEETYSIREFLAVHPNDTVELVVSGGFMIGCIAAVSTNIRALRALSASITKVRFLFCTLNKARIRMLTGVLPHSLRALEFDRCTFKAPIDPLLDELPCLVHLGLGRCESRNRVESPPHSFPSLSSLTKRAGTLEILDLSGLKCRGAHQGLLGLADLITIHDQFCARLVNLLTFAKKIHTIYLGSSLPSVTPDLERALLAHSCLRELYADRCGFTFYGLSDACDEISANGQRPAPALEILDLSENKNIGPESSAVAFLRAVPSLKEIFLQDTGVYASILTEAPNKAVVFHLSVIRDDESRNWFSDPIERAPVRWHRYPRPR